jgi:myo-inositol-1(or 4)-monophosphatase
MAHSPNLAVIERALEKAARSLIRDFNEVEKLQISIKGPGDFVSKADKRAEEIIVESLQKDRPDWGILGEEGSNIKGKDAQYRFIIDPLDGTTNFLHGLPHWCVTIALEKEGEVVAGMTFDPIRQEMFRAEKGSGAFMNNTRLRVSGRKDLSASLIAVGCAGLRAKDPALAGQDLAKIHAVCADARRMASAALDLAYVAAGRFDAYIERAVQPWDIAAGILMVREAAGIVTNTDDLKPGKADSGNVLAGNPVIHRNLAELLGIKSTR